MKYAVLAQKLDGDGKLVNVRLIRTISKNGKVVSEVEGTLEDLGK